MEDVNMGWVEAKTMDLMIALDGKMKTISLDSANFMLKVNRSYGMSILNSILKQQGL